MKGGKSRKKAAKRKPARQRLHASEAPQPPVQPRPEAKPRKLWTVRSRRSLARAIFGQSDPVNVGTKLLEGDGDATVAKSFFQFADWIFGKPAQQSGASGPDGEKAFQFVTYAPRPQYPVDRNSEDQRNKEACRQSLGSASGAGPADFGDVNQEDQND